MPRRTKFTDEKQINAILAGVVAAARPDWYSRVHDDHDGEFTGYVAVCVAGDGDTHIQTGEHPSLRFRNHFGGGSSPRVHNALMILAHAIAADNKDHPNGEPERKLAALSPIPPTWYTRNEMLRYLEREGCRHELAAKLADAYSTNLQMAYDKGWQMSASRRALFAPRSLPTRTMVGDSLDSKPVSRPAFGEFKFQPVAPPTVEIDQTASAVYIQFAERGVARTVPVSAKDCLATVDLDANSEVIGLEIIGVEDYNVAALFESAGFPPLPDECALRARYVPALKRHYPLP